MPKAAPPPQPATTGDGEEGRFWTWAVGAALLLALVALLFWRRRRQDRGAARFEPASSALPSEPEPGPPARLTPTSRLPRRPAPPPPAPSPPAPAPPAASPTPAAVPVPGPALASAPHPLDMQLEARHLSRALVNASLAYRLTLTNRGEAPLGPLRIAGDIVSAHASLTREEQLAPGDAALATIHEVPSLAAGESATLAGELRLPIASIIPIHSGAMRVFVPLARFRADSPDGANTRVFVIGQASDRPGGGLRPFALDRGPGVERGLGQRELAVPA